MMTSTCWKPVLASSVKNVFYRAYSDSSCSTPESWCDSYTDKRCRRSLDECYARGYDGKMEKHVERNNKIYQQLWSNSATCSGAPTTETEPFGGVTVPSASCTRQSVYSTTWYKDVTVGQIPANQCEVVKFFNDTACNQSLGSKSQCSDKVKGPNPRCAPVDPRWKQNPQVPGSAVSMRQICKHKENLYLFYETADCAGCPKISLAYGKDFGIQYCEVDGFVRKSTLQCENIPDTTSQHCLAPGQGSFGPANAATGKSRFLLAVLMLGGLTRCMY
jgi:hypothetical protein